jgi:hypoxanthine phosphoribosyltransferase
MVERLEPLISAARIRRRVAALAREIEADHRDAPLILVAVLKGATIFAADLIRHLSVPCALDFVRASSYRDSTRSSGQVSLQGEAELDISGRRVVLVEDIVDSGLTATRIVAALRRRDPLRIDLCTLVHKQVPGALPVDIRYKGFDAPDCFVVGYGMDYAERYRNLPGLHRLVFDP